MITTASHWGEAGGAAGGGGGGAAGVSRALPGGTVAATSAA